MENNDDNSGNTNWTPPTTGSGQFAMGELPNAKAGFTLGLIGLIVSFICCCGISLIGLVLSIIGFVKSNGAIKLYEANPSSYDEAMYKKAKTGKILSIIGIIVGGIFFIIFLISLAMNGVSSMMDYQEMMRRYR